MSSEISKRLQEVIEKSKYSYTEIEKLSGVPKSAIQRYASGNTTKLPIDRIKDICEAIGASTQYVLGWAEEENSNIYGVHKNNLEYLSKNPELLELYNEIYENQSLQLLFDSARDLTPDDLKMVLTIIKGIRKDRGIE